MSAGFLLPNYALQYSALPGMSHRCSVVSPRGRALHSLGHSLCGGPTFLASGDGLWSHLCCASANTLLLGGHRSLAHDWRSAKHIVGIRRIRKNDFRSGHALGWWSGTLVSNNRFDRRRCGGDSFADFTGGSMPGINEFRSVHRAPPRGRRQR